MYQKANSEMAEPIDELKLFKITWVKM